MTHFAALAGGVWLTAVVRSIVTTPLHVPSSRASGGSSGRPEAPPRQRSGSACARYAQINVPKSIYSQWYKPGSVWTNPATLRFGNAT